MTAAKKPATKGLKTSELWLVVGCALDHIARQADLYELVSQHILTAAEQVQEIADKLHGVDPGGDPTFLYILAAVYVAGRSALKWRSER